MSDKAKLALDLFYTGKHRRCATTAGQVWHLIAQTPIGAGPSYPSPRHKKKTGRNSSRSVENFFFRLRVFYGQYVQKSRPAISSFPGVILRQDPYTTFSKCVTHYDTFSVKSCKVSWALRGDLLSK